MRAATRVPRESFASSAGGIANAPRRSQHCSLLLPPARRQARRSFRLAEPEVDRGRIVVVTAGFGLWLGGRCLAAGRWSDVASIRAYRKSAGDERTYLAVRLR